MTIDTLQLKKDFLSAGFAEQKAETLVKAIHATEQRAATQTDIEHAVELMRKEIENSETRLTNKLYTVAIVICGVILGAIKYL